MGLVDKFKNLFSDEIEEEEKPIKKEVMHVEIESPKPEVKDPDITESEVIKKDEKFVFPVYFDDKDFDTLDYSKPQEPVSVKPKGSYALNKPIPEEKKLFKPSPIISPVYGVLDKNYSKEDIASKPSTKVDVYTSSKDVTIDDVRKKAFGTLEEELETEMFSHNSILFNDELETPEDEEKDIFDEFEDKDEEFDDNSNVSSITIEEELTFEVYEDEKEKEEPKQKRSSNMVETELNNMFDEEEELSDGDLFNLIDSMYEKGDEKNG